ncbi:hypothetical protein PFDSM3638_02250 [Pyrococcus furiosus DSM 3638]|uniref:Uncharacterized protein n=3 Tax=Pyrococcus furiosus TaxID=2261 RepID=Q8U3L3_PYRFU|nr:MULTISPECIES: hypothetical protein [Pyrococcus]AAL80577.1 hypothetical protein PF0453 [Pyrococcus furiosus DSM 3638]AFN03247.1 hypothetical protein PFC_01380 [Pyrococcus furiosus COM1]MDK2869083.1 hypothetical protein [Pyrococcus sp.]QEK78166.1 hypothetical protein PFDSM3638_02250 [Pyrococcus furiosus DSM 3638]
MRRWIISLILITLIMPIVSAQLLEFEPEGKVITLVGAKTTGDFELKNPFTITFTSVTIKDVKILDKNKNEVSGFSISLSPKMFYEWKPEEKRVITYTIVTDKNVAPGEYTLYIFMWGFHDDEMYLIRAYVPLEVKDKPLIFYEAVSYVKERPNSNIVFNGETIIVYSHVANLASEVINATASTCLKDMGGNIVIEKYANLSLFPGDNLVKFELKVPESVPPGNYELTYKISYERGEYVFRKDYIVEFGVSLATISIEKTNVLQGEENYAYVFISSERDIHVNLTVQVHSEDGNAIYKNKTTIKARPGSNLVKIKLPTEYLGENVVNVNLEYDGLKLGSASTWYLVVGYPTLTILTENNQTVLPPTIIINNPNAFQIPATLTYTIRWMNGTIVKEIKEIYLPPGETTVKIPINGYGKFSYEITLTSFGKSTKISGWGEVLPPSETSGREETKPSQTSTTQSTFTFTTKNQTYTTPALTGNNQKTIILLISVMLLVLVGAGIYYYSRKKTRKRKRERPKPKRKSPLGRR